VGFSLKIEPFECTAKFKRVGGQSLADGMIKSIKREAGSSITIQSSDDQISEEKNGSPKLCSM